MSDIAARLRAGVDPDDIPETEAAMDKGADEIEQLNNECNQTMQEIANLRAENERLRAAVQDLISRWADERGMDGAIKRARILLLENALRAPTDENVRRALEGKE